jgi:hypothetical protein
LDVPDCALRFPPKKAEINIAKKVRKTFALKVLKLIVPPDF